MDFGAARLGDPRSQRDARDLQLRHRRRRRERCLDARERRDEDFLLPHALAPLPETATVLRSAFGFGSRTLSGRPNVLRATLLAESAHAPQAPDADLLVLETNLDDCNPEWIGALTSDLLERGALDVWHTPVVMKKGRGGTLLSVLANASDAAALRERVFRSTTTFGIRFYPVQRETLERRFENVRTPWGEVPVKIGSLRGEDITGSPEHDACAALALANNVTPRQVYEAAKQAVSQKTNGNRLT